ncbi:MAG: DUF3343 domain-containing protein [Ruminococcaceae bacterium]|nr:DUF3343 domain-containing protein [Oscillospiraceae bacterium]
MHKDLEGCACIIGSMTETLRAQRALAREAILADTVKADSGKSRRGCAYALSFSCTQQKNVQRILEKNGIRVKAYMGGDVE